MAETMTKEAAIKTPTPKAGVVDLTRRVKLTTTDKHPYHKVDTEVNVAPAVAEKYKANGWAR